MTKFTILLRRNPALTHDEYVTYHKNNHAPLFTSIAAVKRHVRRYVQQYTLSIELPGLPPAKYDGMTELWFDAPESIAVVFTDPKYMSKIRPDEEKFLDLHGCDFIVSDENVVIGT